MSLQKLTLIVTCTDRKSATPRHELMARNLPPSHVEVRARLWTRALSRSASRVSLSDLYRGETWTQVKRLIATAQAVGYEPDVLVASAGLGLRSLHDHAPAYAATFSAGHADSVAASTDEAQDWWRALPRAGVNVRRRGVWVLSENYSRVIGPDLIENLPTDELLVFGGSSQIPDEVRISSDRSLRRTLGGTVTSLNVRTAIQWLLLSRGVGPFAPRAKARWREWTEGARHREEYNRQSLSDNAVLDFVTVLKDREPGISRTRALKALRDSGLACEQQRFSILFQKAVGP